MNRKILVADESIIIQKTVEHIILDKEFDMDVISDGTDALSTIKENMPDIVLADVDLPGMNGYEICGAVKKDFSLKKVQVILLVAKTNGTDEKKINEAGADDYIIKPFEPEELINKIETARSSKETITQLKEDSNRLRNSLNQAEDKAVRIEEELSDTKEALKHLEEKFEKLKGDLDDAGKRADSANKEAIKKILTQAMHGITDNIIREIMRGPVLDGIKEVIEKAVEDKIPYTVERVITEKIEEINAKDK